MIIVEDFTIDGDIRLETFKDLLAHTLTHSTLREPISQLNNGAYHISLRCDADDVIRLEKLLEKWNEEDKLIKQATPKLTPMQSILERFKFSKS